MATSKKESLIQSIMKKVYSLDIAGYLQQEIVELLKYLHYYKLKNIARNIDALEEYLLVLDKNNTHQIHELEYNHHLPWEKTHDNLNYFVSKSWLCKIGENKMHQRLWENEFHLQQIMSGVKWFLLLTADEFCNASPTRMSINRMLWQKELK